MVPESALDRADLGALFEDRGLPSEAAYAYQHAIEIASAGQASLGRWMLTRLLLRQERYREALGEVEVALARDPDNPELHLARAQALAALGDPAALDAYRLAVLKAGVQAGQPAADQQPFGFLPPRGRALVSRALQEQTGPVRYHRALAQYLTDRRLWNQALAEWEAVLAEVPRDAEAHFSRGIVLDGLGTAGPGAAGLSTGGGSRRGPERLPPAARPAPLGDRAVLPGDERVAGVLGQDPGNLEARLGLARAAVKAGDRREAAQEYARILQIVPDQPEARRELARLGRAPGS